MSRRAFLALALAAAIAGCTPKVKQFKNVDLTGADYGREFSLTDHNGKPRTLTDFRGKVVVVFFGFTQCPDICPTTLQELAEISKALGKQADQLQVLFITLDPERDTPALLAEYVPRFDPRFLGLTGTPDAVAAAAREFKVFFQKAPGAQANSYTIDHTAGSYVLDRAGRLRLFVRPGQDTQALRHDLELLLSE